MNFTEDQQIKNRAKLVSGGHIAIAVAATPETPNHTVLDATDKNLGLQKTIIVTE